MDDFEKSIANLERDIEHRSREVIDLERMVALKNLHISNREKKDLMRELHEKDDQFSVQIEQAEQMLKNLRQTEVELGGIITLLKSKNCLLETEADQYNQEIKHLKALLQCKKTEVNDINEMLANALKENDELRYQFQEVLKENADKEFKSKQIISALKMEMQVLEKEIFQTKERNTLLETALKEKDDQLLQKKERLNDALKQLGCENERLEKIMKEKDDALRVQKNQWRQKVQYLQSDVEIRDRKVNTMERIPGKKENTTETELDETDTSKAMGDKLIDNNPNISGLSDRNRPTKLAERCAELYDNQWTDAFDILDKHFHTEENVIEALLLILQDSLTFCITKAQEQMEVLGRELKFTDEHRNGDASAGVSKLLKDCRRAMAHVAVENLHKIYVSHLKRSTDKTLRTALEVSSYTTECLEICWFMVIHDPPVVFAPLLRKGSRFNTDLYKPYTMSGTYIDYVVWPPLLLHEGGPILAKGIAQGYRKK